jgi:antitoxin ParD1/3/4
MPTHSVVFTDHEVELIDRLILFGRYQSTDEVLRAGLRMLEEHERKIAAPRHALKVGEDNGDAGGFDMDAIKRKAKAKGSFN